MASVITSAEDDDRFQCGKCKLHFNNLFLFLAHKKYCKNVSDSVEYSIINEFSVEETPGNIIILNTDDTNSYTVTEQNVFYHNADDTLTVVNEKNDYEKETDREIIQMSHNAIVSQNIIQSTVLNLENEIPQSSPDEIKLPANTDSESNTSYCNLCHKYYKSRYNLRVHMRSHAGEKPFQCAMCGRCFTQKSQLNNHLNSHKVWPDVLSQTLLGQFPSPSPNKTYKCPFCTEILPHYQKFRTHLKKHKSEKVWMCLHEFCKDTFTSVDALLQHVHNTHDRAQYICCFCGKTFNHLDSIAVHYQGHKSTTTPHSGGRDQEYKRKKHFCPYCSEEFSTTEKLKYHMENHSHPCSHCNKMFTSVKSLRYHIQIHLNNKHFQCAICGVAFTYKHYLSMHMLKHGERNFECSKCHLRFKRKDILTRHYKTHQSHKLFKCPFKDSLGCCREFSRMDKFNLHVKCHSRNVVMKSKSIRRKKQDDTSVIEIVVVQHQNEMNGS